MLPSQTRNIKWRGRGLCDGNIITAAKSWWRWRMGDDIRPISHSGLGWPGQAWASPRYTDQSLLQPAQKLKKGTLNYANLQDKYILILLEYKLMLQLSDQTLCYKSRRTQEYKITLWIFLFNKLMLNLRKTTDEELSSSPMSVIISVISQVFWDRFEVDIAKIKLSGSSQHTSSHFLLPTGGAMTLCKN